MKTQEESEKRVIQEVAESVTKAVRDAMYGYKIGNNTKIHVAVAVETDS